MMDAWVASVSSFARTKCWLSQRLSDFGTSLQARYALAALSGQAHSLGPREKHAALRFMLGLPDTPRSQRVLESKETARSPTPGAASCMEGRCSTSVSRGGARAQAWRNTLYTFARARFVKGPRPHHLDTPAPPPPPLCVWCSIRTCSCGCVWRRTPRPPRCVSTGPVVVRLAEMVISREREREHEAREG